jgi:four helix bundle protein
MKKGKHSTFNIQHSTPKDLADGVLEFHEGPHQGRKFDLEDRLLEFASAVIDLSESLPATRSGNHVAGQVLRSGTSPYPNHGEAEAAESRDDFIHKLKICLKELRETRRWARLVKRKAWVKNEATLLFVLGECEELIRIFHSSIQTAKRNAQAEARKPSNPVRYPASEAG